MSTRLPVNAVESLSRAWDEGRSAGARELYDALVTTFGKRLLDEAVRHATAAGLLSRDSSPSSRCIACGGQMLRQRSRST